MHQGSELSKAVNTWRDAAAQRSIILECLASAIHQWTNWEQACAFRSLLEAARLARVAQNAIHVDQLELSAKDKDPERGRAIFNMMDGDGNGTVDVDEICMVHDSDKEAMLNVLDVDGNKEVCACLSVCQPSGSSHACLNEWLSNPMNE